MPIQYYPYEYCIYVQCISMDTYDYLFNCAA